MGTPRNTFSYTSSSPLRSEFADDATMVELIDYFLDELQERISSLDRALEDGNREDLRMVAHQLKGAAGGYGFPTITEAAADLEGSLRAGEVEVSAISEKVESLISQCKRAIAGGRRVA